MATSQFPQSGVATPNVLCFESNSSMLLIFYTPTFNNETISSKIVVVPIENNYGYVSKIISSFS
jgi:hypothetical protein